MTEREQDGRRVVEALNAAGLEVSSVFDLVNTKRPYPEAIPVLVELLPRVREEWIREGIVRALTVKEARPAAAKPLIEEFRRIGYCEWESPLASLKWAVGNALSVVADDDVFEDVARLVVDRRHGRTREMLAVALGRMKNRRAEDVLIRLLEDEEVAGHAIIALGKLRSVKARPRIEGFLDHPKSWIRTEAKLALAKISGSRRSP